MNTYGYIRISSKTQNEERQVVALLEFGVERKHLFVDVQSGKDFERPQYRRLMRRLKEGDVMVLKSIDRLGRNYDEIQEQWKVITKKIKAQIVILDMPLCATRS